MDFQPVAFPPSEVVFTQHFFKIVVEVIALGPPHIHKTVVGVSKGMLPVEFFWR